MNVSLQWLGELLGAQLDLASVSERFAMLGSPVERVDKLGEGLQDVVVGLVEKVEPHPNADRLSVCQVNDGSEVLEVVCGAPNVRSGAKYPFAPAGSTLPGGMKLKRAKIRGVTSNGMLCSARELELGTDHEGILELTTEAAPGTKFTDALGLSDVRLEIEVTPNRPDLLCLRGVARDLGAALDLPVKLPPITGGPRETKAPVRVERLGKVGNVPVSIEDAQGCPRYLAAVVEGVTIGASPNWLQTRLRSIGQRPINNVVDATNYIMHELNHPMHAFDLDRLAGPAIVVRSAKEGERLTTLDGEARTMSAGMTMICDANGSVAIGGVMGGEDSEVTSETKNVVLECAYFDPRTIRHTRTALRMSTEASYRFERGTDIHAMPESLRRAVALIIAVAGGTERDPPVDVYPKERARTTVFLRPQRVAHVLGVDIPTQEVEQYLVRLGFVVAPKGERLAVQVPGWRIDVAREEDLIEEIARIRGYDSFEPSLLPFRPSTVPDDTQEDVKARCRHMLTAFGLYEARSSSLGPKMADDAWQVLKPLSAEEAFLRTDLLAGLLKAVEHNWSVRERDIRLFEIGIVFRGAGRESKPSETVCVAGVVSGARHPRHWSTSFDAVDFDLWDVKSLLESVVATCGRQGEFVIDGDDLVLLDGKTKARIGWAGAQPIEPPAWAAPVFGFEVELAKERAQIVSYVELPTTPPIERDLALVVPAGVSAAQVEGVVRMSGGTYLQSCVPFDEYRGKGASGRSVAWRLVFRAADRTLRDREVDVSMERIIASLQEQLGVARREA